MELETVREHISRNKKVYYVATGAFCGIVLLALLISFVVWLTMKTPIPECYSMPGKQSQLVVNGTAAKLNEFPFYVSIKYSYYRIPHCGGSIIAPNWVLTAQHCVFVENIVENCKKSSKDALTNCFQVVAGSRNGIFASDGTIHNVIDIRPFKDYKKFDSSADIALLQIHPPFEYRLHTSTNRGVTSVCLPEKNNNVTEEQLGLIGFGRISEFHGIRADRLMTTKLNHADVDDCFRVFWNYDIKKEDYSEDYKNRFVCAGISEESKGACSGDSGGPLSFQRKNKAIQIGVVSSVPSTGCGEKYTMFMSVTHYRDWIREITKV